MRSAVPALERIRPLPREPDRGGPPLQQFRCRRDRGSRARVPGPPSCAGRGRRSARAAPGSSRRAAAGHGRPGPQSARNRGVPGPRSRWCRCPRAGSAPVDKSGGGAQDDKDLAMISYRAFTKRFGALRAVESLSLHVARGEVVALLGPNGSGKTTTLKAAAGLIVPSAGEVWLGDPPRPAGEPEARRILSYLPQKVSFPDALTGNEVVEFYRELRGAPPGRSRKVLRFASLNGAGERTVGTYSGGMVQRLGLAVAMVAEAPVFLLDEPTA